MFKTSRRGFMVGCSAAIASITGGISFTAFGSAENEPNQDILVVVFLRGGCDGLNLVPPLTDPDRAEYLAKRPNIAIPDSGDNAAYPLSNLFGLHGAAGGLFELYQSKRLAIVHAAGLTSDTRSHFDAMQYVELGTPGSKSGTTGWLTRHLQTADNLPAEIIMPALAMGNLQPTSLAGSLEAIGMTGPSGFSFNGHWNYDDWLHQAGVQTLNAVDVVEWADPGDYQPANGATYPGSTFGRNLQSVAQMIKMQLGLRVATVDLGGWDTHEYQGDNGGGYFSNKIADLAGGLNAFYTDLSDSTGTDHTKRLTVVVMSEFGRSFQQNASRGCDHGHGNVMLVLGGNVNGGKVYGTWPGLQPEKLYDRRDLDITTDYRRVLSEILIRRLGNPKLGDIFPGYSGYQPLGVLQGTDLAPVYTPTNPGGDIGSDPGDDEPGNDDPDDGTTLEPVEMTERLFVPMVAR